MKKFYLLTVLVIAAFTFQAATKKSVMFSSVPPEGHTGESGSYCTSCHNSFALNSGGGSVATSGLPTGNFVAGQAYNFSVTISHGAANRQKWGFSIKAVNSNGQSVGTFSSTNANAAVNGTELSHNTAVTTSPQSSFTYNNLKWTAPASPLPADKNVTFYYVGNAANGNFNNQGDYIYSGVKSIVLPIKIKGFTITNQDNIVKLDWQTISEVNSDHFGVEKSDDGQFFYPIGTINSKGNTNTPTSYSYTDSKPSYYGKNVYYRLKMVDKDGGFTYSEVVSTKLKAGNVQVVKAYPTLIKPNATVTAEVLSDKKQSMQVTLIDASGKVLQQFIFSLNTGNNQIFFTPQTSNEGWLFAKFQAVGFQQTIALMMHQK